jgi:hypothetical protein
MKTNTDSSPLPLILDSEASVANAGVRGFHLSAVPDKAAHEEILHRAYSIWECAGRPRHCEAEHWLKAEREVLSEV